MYHWKLELKDDDPRSDSGEILYFFKIVKVSYNLLVKKGDCSNLLF